MKMLYHKDANVRYEALLALQKMMVTNWWMICYISISGIFIPCWYFFRKYLTSKEELEQTKKKPASR